MPIQARITLAAVRPQVPAARRWAALMLAGWGIAAPERENALLLLSELAANAVMHAGGRTFRTWLYTDWEPGRAAGGLVIMVGDDSRLMPVPPPADPLAECGRGLRIVASLAERWDAYPTPAGKVVWALLPLAP